MTTSLRGGCIRVTVIADNPVFRSRIDERSNGQAFPYCTVLDQFQMPEVSLDRFFLLHRIDGATQLLVRVQMAACTIHTTLESGSPFSLLHRQPSFLLQPEGGKRLAVE